jgi:methionine aminopeptidase
LNYFIKWHAIYSDLGAHVDGFIAVVAHSLVIGATKEDKCTGRRADVMLAAHLASQAALRLLKAGNEVRKLNNTVFSFLLFNILESL